MSNCDPQTSWTQPISSINPLYRSFGYSTQETSLAKHDERTGGMSAPFSVPSNSSQMMTLNEIYELHSRRCNHAKNRYLTATSKETADQNKWDCSFSIDGALLVMSVLGILLSGTVIILCILLLTGVISFTVNYTKVTGDPSLCQCEGSTTPRSLMDFEQELEDIQCQMNLLKAKIPVSISKAVQRAEELLLHTEAINKAMEQKISSFQIPALEVSGLNFPAHININMSDGCIQRVDIQPFDGTIRFESFVANQYMSGTRIIIDSVCTVVVDGKETNQGKGVTRVTPMENNGISPSLGNIFDFLTTAELHCNCYYWGDLKLANAVCKQVIVWCPYAKQSISISANTLS